MDQKTKTCDHCDRPVHALGICVGHYEQQRKGRPFGPLRPKRLDARERDDQGRKWCAWSSHWADTGGFATSKYGPDGLAHRCSECVKLSRMGLRLSDYQQVLAAQGGGCAVCGGVSTDGRALSIDHDHACCPGKTSCGKCVRGLLCNSCNLGIGSFRDSPQRLRSAADYLDRTTSAFR